MNLLDEFDDDAEDKVINEYNSYLDQYSQERSDQTNAALAAIDTALKTLNGPTGDSDSISRPDSSSKPKICEALRPFKLRTVHSPADLRSWNSKFSAYYSTSNMSLFSVEEQHALLCCCISTDLETRIRENDLYSPSLAVFGDHGLPLLIKQDFLHRYPLFNRRLEFFRLTQAAGQPFSEFMVKLKQKGEEADLAQLGIEQMYIYRYLTGVSDPRL